MHNIKVLLFTDTFCDINGVSRFIQDISTIAQQNALEFHVITSSMKSCPDLKNVYNVKPTFKTKMPFYPDLDLVLPSYKELKRITDEIQPDVVHISTPGFIGLMGRRIAKKRALPMIGTYHTDFPQFVYKNVPFAAVKSLSNAFMRHFYKDFEKLFVRSEEYRQIVHRDVKFGNDRIYTLKAGIDTEKFNKKHKDMQTWETYGIPKDAVKALYVGRFTKEKNFPLLLELWKQYYEKYSDKNVYLVVLGGDLEDDTLFEKYHIKSLGVKRGQELSTLYASSDLFVFPSTTDTLGQVVMEAMSSGLPVIVSNEGGPQTLIDDTNISGYAIDVNNKQKWIETMDLLMSDRALREKLGENGYQTIADMGIGKSFESFWQEHQASAATKGE